MTVATSSPIAISAVPDVESTEAAMALTPQEFYAALTTRNTGVVGPLDQETVANARVLVAGCGSIGGAAVEPLVRFGFQHLILADPGTYELTNLNRQNATVADLGRQKVEVSCERALAINPHAEIAVVTAGVTADNVDELVKDVAIVIDGVDITTRSGLVAKGLLHQAAKAARLPLFTGWDMSGTQYIRVYDYRKDIPLFDGQVTLRETETQSMWPLLARMVPARKVPRDLLRIIRTGLERDVFTFPQLVHAADQFGAVATSLAYNIATGRKVATRVTIDIHARTTPPIQRVKESLLQPVEAARLLRSIISTSRAQ